MDMHRIVANGIMTFAIIAVILFIIGITREIIDQNRMSICSKAFPGSSYIQLDQCAHLISEGKRPYEFQELIGSPPKKD